MPYASRRGRASRVTKERTMRVLLVINAALEPDREREIAAGLYPRKDYHELQRATGADIIDLATLDARPWTRLLRRAAGPVVAQALLAWSMSRHYDAVYADQETTGFALAALYKPFRRRPRLTMIGHLLSARAKQALCRGLRLGATIDAVVVHSSLQARLAERTLGLRPDQVALVPYQTDERFWTPRAVPTVPTTNRICSAGLEYRDYDTLIEAVAGLSVEVVIAAASPWSTFTFEGEDRALPSNVVVDSFDYAGLRELYASSLFVVVPLRDVENQAGITTILEAMAMGKAVVVSHTRGQTDVVRDRRQVDRTDPRRSTQPDWAARLGTTDEVARGQTGIYVRPGDAGELRRALQFLLGHPAQAREMGANGRSLLAETMGLDLFTARVAAVIAGGAPPGPGADRSGAPFAGARLR